MQAHPPEIDRFLFTYERTRVRWHLAWAWLQMLEAHVLSSGMRALDSIVSAALLVALAPVLAFLFVLARAGGGGIVTATRVGRHGAIFERRSFHFGKFRVGRLWQSLPVLLNVLAGDLSFVGPRALAPAEVRPRHAAFWKRHTVRPGLISLWWMRQRANIAFDDELAADTEYVETHSLGGDLGILLRAAPAALYGGTEQAASARVSILNVRMDNRTLQETADEIVRAGFGRMPSQICFVNADCINIACSDARYREVLARSRLTLPDGIGLKIAGQILARPIRQNVNGTDLFPRLCAAAERAGASIYLLGGRDGVAAGTAAWIRQYYPGVRLAGVCHGYFTAEEEAGVIAAIAAAAPEILLVAFGAPRQDLWIHRHLEKLNAGAAAGVGGLFDFYSGRIPRAPQWLREMGLEWIYRFLQEPRRMWKRYFIGNALFLVRVTKERLHPGAIAQPELRNGGTRA